MRAVLDVNVLVSALLSRNGAPARVLGAWLDGRYDLVVSPRLVEELRRTLTYPKLRRRIDADEADRYVAILLRGAFEAPDPATPAPYASSDPDDDYLIALAASREAMLITGDGHLLDLAERAPIHTPAEFAEMLGLD